MATLGEKDDLTFKNISQEKKIQAPPDYNEASLRDMVNPARLVNERDHKIFFEVMGWELNQH